jgi:hypothetical protein
MDFSMVLMLLSLALAIATVVLLIIAWTSTTPFGTNNRQEGLQITIVFALLGIWCVGFAHMMWCRWKRGKGIMGSLTKAEM